ncbi:MAG: hypothetical protein DDT19_02505 [Syntrophomonadaceae bacterium]|nr:hypothetical protein [Bacillota bacterium]
MTTLEFARYYLSKGFSVIPLREREKEPALQSWKEYQTRKPTDNELAKWFGNKSQNNIGVVAGAVSGIAVVDLDSSEAERFARENDFPSTPLVKTGKGYHAYYKYKEGTRNFQKKDDLPGIDLRGDGGCVAAPPSIHPSGKRYEWVEGKGLDDLPLAELPEIILARAENKTPLKKLYRGVDKGNRNDSLARLAGSWVNDGLTFEECLENAFLWNSKNNPPLDSREIEKTVKSIFDRHQAKMKTIVTEVTFTDKNLIPFYPFPFNVFPQKMLDVIQKLSNALHVEPEVIASAMLTITSGALGNTIKVSPKHNYEVAPFIWLIIVALSGYGKSPVIQILLRPVKQLQAEAYQIYQAELKKYELQLKKAKSEPGTEIPEKPRLKHFFVSDCTVEALANVFENDSRGVIIYQDEIAGLILGLNQYKGKGNDRQHYLELFSCDSWKIDRKSGVKFIRNTGASIIGGIQPKVMPRVFNVDSFDDGLLPRFLLLNAENRPSKFSRQAITEDIISYWMDLLNWCYEIHLIQDESGFVKPKVLILSNEALNLWEHFYNDYGSKMPFLSDRARVFIPKLTAYYSLKFAGVLHAIKAFNKGTITTSSVIDDETIHHAIELTHYFAGQAMRALKHYEGDTLTEYQKRLVETLYHLQGEVKSGKLQLSRIVELFNSGLPEAIKHTPHKISKILSDFGLTTDKSSGNLSFLVWETEKIQKLFSETNVTNVTKVTNQEPERVTEVTKVTLDSEDGVIDLTGDDVEFIG